MKRDKIIDHLVLGRSGFLGDGRDLLGLGPQANSYRRLFDRIFQNSAGDYRELLEGLSDEELIGECVLAEERLKKRRAEIEEAIRQIRREISERAAVSRSEPRESS